MFSSGGFSFASAWCQRNNHCSTHSIKRQKPLTELFPWPISLGEDKVGVVSCLTLEGVFLVLVLQGLLGKMSLSMGIAVPVVYYGSEAASVALWPMCLSSLQQSQSPFYFSAWISIYPRRGIILGLVSWFISFDMSILQLCSADVKWPICLDSGSAAVIYISWTSLSFIIRGITGLTWTPLNGFKWQNCKTEEYLQPSTCNAIHAHTPSIILHLTLQ